MTEEPKWGKPEEMSEEERKAGVEGTIASIHTPAQRAMCDASGRVSDHRRMVAFVYLLLRDVMTCGRMGEIVIEWEREDYAASAAKFDYLAQDPLVDPRKLGTLDSRADRLVPEGSSNESVRAFLGLVHHTTWYMSDAALDSLYDMLPENDDVTTVFTNGWLARYAQYLTDQITRGQVVPVLADDACEEAKPTE